MRKDEILARSRAENKPVDEREVCLHLKAAQITVIVTIVLCLAFSLVNFILSVLGKRDFYAWDPPALIMFGVMVAFCLTKGIFMKKKTEIVVGIIGAVCLVIFAMLYVLTFFI